MPLQPLVDGPGVSGVGLAGDASLRIRRFRASRTASSAVSHRAGIQPGDERPAADGHQHQVCLGLLSVAAVDSEFGSVVHGCSRVLPSRIADELSGGLLGLDLGKPAGCFAQTVVIGPAAGTALKVDRRARVNACRVSPGELQLDVCVEDLLAGRAPRVPVLGAQQLVKATKIRHQAASLSGTGCPAAAILARRLRLASNGFL
jgi:hypothetical protein